MQYERAENKWTNVGEQQSMIKIVRLFVKFSELRKILNKWSIVSFVDLENFYVVTSAVVATSVFLWSSELKLTKKLTRLVSTSNKRSSSGEMKKRPEEGDIYREIWILTPMDQRTELW